MYLVERRLSSKLKLIELLIFTLVTLLVIFLLVLLSTLLISQTQQI